MIKRSAVGFISVLVLFLVPFIAVAQNSNTTVAGQVLDPAGAAVASAQVTLQPAGVTVATNARGEFTIPNIVPGDYKLTISYVGFEDFQQDLSIKTGDAPHI